MSREHLKRLEGEVLNQLNELGETQDALDLGRETVNLQQLRGIEINERAAALAELVLWIGFLQWHIRSFGNSSVAEPVVHDYGNIENRDAVLEYDSVEPMTDEAGNPVMRWDGVTTKTHPATGQQVPDDAAQVVQWRYINARQAQWPTVDFIVGNPPFIGASTMRSALGDGYVDALRGAWPKVPDSADFVMYWWCRSAELVCVGQVERFGLITTNSLRQTFNRRVVQLALKDGLSLLFAIPDHPWVDSANGAAVRIAMTVAMNGSHEGRLLTLTSECPGDHGEASVVLTERRGSIHPDLRIGANVAAAIPMNANAGISSRGFELGNAGFIVTREQAASIGLGTVPGLERYVHEYRNGRDLASRPRGVMVIDMFGLTADDFRAKFPDAYQWLLERVKPERDVNRDDRLKTYWWLHRRLREDLREMRIGVPRYIATVETAKHRVFQFLDIGVMPDNKLVAIALSDAFQLGVLSSSAHVSWAMATGSTLEDRPVYVKTTCFERFPFPSEDTGLTQKLTERIRSLAEQLDAHRKTRQAAHSTVTITGMYNVLEKLRNGEVLTAAERTLNDNGLVSVLRSLHDELDTAVLAAYGWGDLSLPADTDALLLRLVELNTKRANEETAGLVRWLRPDFQRRAGQGEQSAIEGDAEADGGAEENAPTAATPTIAPKPWPAGLAEQIKAVADVLTDSGTSLDLDGLAARFSSRGRWRERLPTILDTLVALGRARTQDSGRWLDAGR